MNYNDLVEALDAVRVTQEYAQLPAEIGWAWYDFYRKHRPEDADRLRREWQEAEKHHLAEDPDGEVDFSAAYPRGPHPFNWGGVR